MLGKFTDSGTFVMGRYDWLTNQFTHNDGSTTRIYFAAWDSIGCTALIVPGSMLAERRND